MERLIARRGLALMAEFNHGIGLRKLMDRLLPPSGSNRGFDPSVMVDSLVLMLQGWSVCLVGRVTPILYSLGLGSLPIIFLLGSNGSRVRGLG